MSESQSDQLDLFIKPKKPGDELRCKKKIDDPPILSNSRLSVKQELAIQNERKRVARKRKKDQEDAEIEKRARILHGQDD
ncbi:hypothetical protein COU24_01290 [Candidatus Kuenenbacteria bacterium CG10_big_fil_rev_8_21_14_0_10_39_14]|uniref:Uncharacterized protein n=4 Tax=Candidatus Kueneniibacteriota TaxID=1752740 RepID=A0A2M7MGH4_9BACT|nr:hypothetical protein [Candidatus Kuenenbacteria bacterium]OIP56443.1 MAG: hypothetical protein AUK13_01040 [Candidatus Kuenenbacteria bacterium CG2_30_39_24]PIP75970.1 MAG: hypothetical protein COW86_00740 [Candidatus Kuenenbacteria bacterium CG22_combo_CG10-13_8_21_14_all_39_9]PIR80929.1 MAG: hypothetical protein COU24_01290 [Candidatus Kuenenbacteria bacterium CG10_big_fil_rev_8_21_14_0_10_39_14]PIX92198.1 MAG: hypothetical protein COZ26_03075 [Candidatus Kuenenbacteria bacterium CG_4_10_1